MLAKPTAMKRGLQEPFLLDGSCASNKVMTHDTVQMLRRSLVKAISLFVLWIASVGSVSSNQIDVEVPFVTPLTVEDMTGKQLVLETDNGNGSYRCCFIFIIC